MELRQIIAASLLATSPIFTTSVLAHEEINAADGEGVSWCADLSFEAADCAFVVDWSSPTEVVLRYV